MLRQRLVLLRVLMDAADAISAAGPAVTSAAAVSARAATSSLRGGYYGAGEATAGRSKTAASVSLVGKLRAAVREAAGGDVQRGLTRQQVASALEAAGLRGARFDSARLFDLLDVAGAGRVGVSELMLGVAHLLPAAAGGAGVLELAFAAADHAEKGHLSLAELQQLLEAFGAAPSALPAGAAGQSAAFRLQEEISELFARMDVDHDGRVTFEEFSGAVAASEVLTALLVLRDATAVRSALGGLGARSSRDVASARARARSPLSRPSCVSVSSRSQTGASASGPRSATTLGRAASAASCGARRSTQARQAQAPAAWPLRP